MSTLRPFFLLVGRASVFWLGLAFVVPIGLFVAGTLESDSRLRGWVDGLFVAAFAFPAAAGWIAGGVIQEAQHTSFLGSLPRVRGRLAPGYLLSGAAVAVTVTFLIAVNATYAPGPGVLLATGFASYCFGGILADAANQWASAFNTLVLLTAVGMSRNVTRFATAYPWLFVAIALAAAGAACWRLFATSTFRSKPFRPSIPFPGRFFAERSLRFEKEKRLAAGIRKAGWRGVRLGNRPWAWVRAAFYEAHGPLEPRTIVRGIGRLWPMTLLPALYTWADMGDMSFPEALGKCMFDGLFRSPHHPPFGEKGGPYVFVVLVIASLGAVKALVHPTALRSGLTYPLSRRERAGVLFRGGLFDGVLIFVGVGTALFALGLAMAWLAGYSVQLDYLPFYLRALLATVALLPLAHMGFLRLGVTTVAPDSSPMAFLVAGVVAFVAAVCLWVFLAPAALGSTALEAGILAVVLVATQSVYRRALFQALKTADLV